MRPLLGAFIGLVLVASVCAPAGAQTPSPAPVASPAIAVDRHRLTLGPGTSATVHVFGASAVTLSISFAGIAAVFDAPTHTITISASQVGTGSVTVADGHGGSDRIDVSVVPPAGVVPPTATLTLVGTPSIPYALTRIRATLRATSALAAGCDVILDVKPADLPPLTSNTTIDIGVRLRGPNFAEVSGHTLVSVHVDPALDESPPRTLLYSDDPERVSTDGVLFASTSTIDESHPARLYAYHSNGRGNRNVYVVLRTKGAASRVQIVGPTLGPSGDYTCLGHEATSVYMQRLLSHQGFALDVSSSAPAIIKLNARPMPLNTLAIGAFDLHVVSGDALSVAVVSAEVGHDPLELVGGPELASDGHGRRGEYDLGRIAPTTISFESGAADPAPTNVGYAQNDPDDTIEFPSVRPDGSPLTGLYGVLRTLHFSIRNPTALPQTAYLYAIPAFGPDTMTLWFGGEPAPIEIPRLTDPNTAYLVRAFPLQPQQNIEADALFMDDGSSWYPVRFGFSGKPPNTPPSGSYAACVQAVEPSIG